jgi:hypothetical protein
LITDTPTKPTVTITIRIDKTDSAVAWASRSLWVELKELTRSSEYWASISSSREQTHEKVATLLRCAVE